MTSVFSWQNSASLFPFFILYSKAKLACYSRYLLTYYFCIPVPCDEKDICWGVSLEDLVGLHRTILRNHTDDGSKVQCYKEQYCIGIWNVRSMNQGKLEVVKQEMARVNVDILGISELRWTGMGEFNSDDHYIYYCGQESHRRNGVAIMVNKRV